MVVYGAVEYWLDDDKSEGVDVIVERRVDECELMLEVVADNLDEDEAAGVNPSEVTDDVEVKFDSEVEAEVEVAFIVEFDVEDVDVEDVDVEVDVDADAEVDVDVEFGATEVF
ncbi:hypothetical protein WICMUC_005276 [Wickerhamomyces mucosus]|uniref:Uncharacterized protein n=1 Tax=Wickerhamomyces mucosus TaxID=1378264 RepID=A0A9P8T6S9_9ASCO|nr:hypothetical protein WICMUC_005276 [Wickerhamomyces mucosus]